MSENDSSHIDMLSDSVGSDTCQYSWVVRVCFQPSTKKGCKVGTLYITKNAFIVLQSIPTLHPFLKG